VVKDVLEAVACLLDKKAETTWESLKALISATSFPERIQRLDIEQNVSKEQFRKLRQKLQHQDFDEELIKTVCVPVVPLAIWCRSIGVYLSKTKFQGGPEIRHVAAAGGTSARRSTSQPEVYGRSRSEEDYEMVFEPDITTFDDDELQCVENFSISRKDVGIITFDGVTDCRDLDFESIVRLEIGEVLVYPDGASKPPVGTGLNKPATVTMYQCWPPNGSKLLADPKSQERYKKKIKQMTEEKHARFIDYDCTTGVWTFSVDHF
jgi:hypothetical protein